METKSRYQVIGELEAQKRQLIQEKSQLDQQLHNKQDNIKELNRKRDDINRAIDRELEDAAEEVKRFQASMEERKATIEALIASVDTSLERLNTK